MDDQTPATSEKKPPRPVKLVVVVVIAVLIALVPALLVRGLVYGFKSWNFRWSDRVAVFEGGSGVMMGTPEFRVEHDWVADIELTGPFSKVTLTKADQMEAQEVTELLDSKRPTNRISTSISIGGTYHLRFEGTGTWKATIRQPR